MISSRNCSRDNYTDRFTIPFQESFKNSSKYFVRFQEALPTKILQESLKTIFPNNIYDGTTGAISKLILERTSAGFTEEISKKNLRENLGIIFEKKNHLKFVKEFLNEFRKKKNSMAIPPLKFLKKPLRL